MKYILSLLMTGLLVTSLAFAEDSTENEGKWGHESELSIVNVDGNTTGEITSAKQKTEYKYQQNAYALTGRFVRVRSNNQETARAWDFGARFERMLSPMWSAFLGQTAESDVYSGYLQRDHTDVGGKLFFEKSAPTLFFAEAGFRYSKTLDTQGGTQHSNGLRLYSEFNRKPSQTLSYKIWLEYLPDLRRSEAYFINAEPSLSVMLSQILSLKTSYLMKYKSITTSATEKQLDTTFTTSIVAKF